MLVTDAVSNNRPPIKVSTKTALVPTCLRRGFGRQVILRISWEKVVSATSAMMAPTAPFTDIGTNRKGFTLLEVIISIAIIGLVVTTLLIRRAEIVQEAGRIKEIHLAQLLAGFKMAEFELALKKTPYASYSESGVFKDYEGYSYEFNVSKKDITVSGTLDKEIKQKPLFLTDLTVRTPSGWEVKLKSYLEGLEETQ